MNASAFVTALAVAGIVALGIVGMLQLGPNADKISLAAVSTLGGFIGGVGIAKAIS